MKKTIIVFVLYFVLSLVVSHAQTQLDSLKILSETEMKDEKWVDEMLRLTREIYNSDSKAAKQYILEIIKTAEDQNYTDAIIDSRLLYSNILKILAENSASRNNLFETLKLANDNISKAKVYIGLANFYDSIDENDSTLLFCKMTENILAGTNSIILGDAYNLFGNAYDQMGNYTKAIEKYYKAVDIYLLHNNETKLANIYNGIAVTNSNLGFYDKANEYFNKAIEIHKKQNNLRGLIFCYTNLAVNYRQTNLPELALEYYDLSLEMTKKLGDLRSTARTLMNIANVYQQYEKYNEALELYDEAIDICRQANITIGYVYIYLNMGITNGLLGKYNQAFAFLDSSLIYAKKLSLKNEEALIYKNFSEIYEKKNDYKNTFSFYKKYQEITDTLTTKEKEAKFHEIQTKFETQQKENEILTLESENSNKKLTISYLVLAFLLLVILFVWFIYRKRLTDKKLLLAEKERNIAHLENENIQIQIEYKNKELAQKALNIAKLHENTIELKSDLNQIMINPTDDKDREFRKLLNKLDNSIENPSIWEEFDLRFKEIHVDFYKTLISTYPDLSKTEVKIISLIRLNLNTKEIADITNRSLRTIQNTRNSIRRKMKLNQEDDLATKIMSL